jgi:hypothetical protein
VAGASSTEWKNVHVPDERCAGQILGVDVVRSSRFENSKQQSRAAFWDEFSTMNARRVDFCHFLCMLHSMKHDTLTVPGGMGKVEGRVKNEE